MSWASYDIRYGRSWIGRSAAGTIKRLVLSGFSESAGIEMGPRSDTDRLVGTLADYFNGAGEWPSDERFIESGSDTLLDSEIYRTVTAIPVGATMTYSAVASLSDRPGAAHGVGAAMLRKRFVPMISCHRAVDSDGSL